MNISPFVHLHTRPYTLPPTAVIPLIGVTLASATSALLTRCVEHSLWETLLRDRSITPTGRRLTSENTSKQAQWSTSSFARLLYSFNGQSLTLRFGRLFLLGAAIVNPVLLCGVRPESSLTLERSDTVPTGLAFAGFTSGISASSPLPDGK